MGCTDYWFLDYQPKPMGKSGNLHELLIQPDFTNHVAREMMLNVYAGLPYMVLPGLKRLFQGAGNGVHLFHCTAGKDRTGTAAALLLTALGASRDAILADYQATAAFDILNSPGFKNSGPFSAERIEIIRPIFDLEVAYLDMMFDEIIKREGSVDGFFKKQLELTAADIDALRKRLVA
jgi:protein-tyrosine phosphatase